MLQALAGQATTRRPVTLLTWGYDYVWRVAGLEPWQLACGGSRTWHAAYLALLERHRPDGIIYSGAGSGPLEPTLVSEDANRWIVRDNNTGRVHGLTKGSLTLYDLGAESRSQDPGDTITCPSDADLLVQPAELGPVYLDGLRHLIEAVGGRALVMPHGAPGYILGCFSMGFQSAMAAMVEDPELFLYVCDRHDAVNAKRLRQLAAAGAEAIFVADSWASCDIISPALFERFAWPYQAAFTRDAHAAGLRMILWNLGDIGPLLRLEAALPVDGFAFEQPRKTFTITVERVREAFGVHRCLFGNLDSEGLLLRNDAREIAAEVNEQVRQSGAGAPFIHCTGSPIPSDVEPSAVDAMVQAAHQVDGYIY